VEIFENVENVGIYNLKFENYFLWASLHRFYSALIASRSFTLCSLFGKSRFIVLKLFK